MFSVMYDNVEWLYFIKLVTMHLKKNNFNQNVNDNYDVNYAFYLTNIAAKLYRCTIKAGLETVIFTGHPFYCRYIGQ